MDNPQERVIKKMINNIVEQNRPVFEKPAGASSEPTHGAAATSHASHAGNSSEDTNMLSRKIEYGFNSMRAENAELRRMLDEMSGAVKMLRNDMDSLRMTVQQVARGSQSSASAPMGHASPAAAPRGAQGSAMGAPQYKKTEADEAYERDSGNPSHDEHDAGQPQARGFAKKEDKGAEIDISKVFYYGKK